MSGGEVGYIAGMPIFVVSRRCLTAGKKTGFMKRSIYFVGVLLVGVLATGCGRNKTIELPQTAVIEMDTTFEAGNCRYETSYYYAHMADADRSPVFGEIERQLPALFFGAVGEEHLMDRADRSFEEFVAEYHESLAASAPDFENRDFVVPFTADIESAITFPSDTLFQYEVNSYCYYGGAHGMSADLVYLFSLRDGRPLGLEDFYSPEQYDGLDQTIRERLASDFGVTVDSLPTAGFFSVEGIVHNENFRIAGDSVTFVYNQYDIAPYSMGIIEVTVPYVRSETPVAAKPGR